MNESLKYWLASFTASAGGGIAFIETITVYARAFAAIAGGIVAALAIYDWVTKKIKKRRDARTANKKS